MRITVCQQGSHERSSTQVLRAASSQGPHRRRVLGVPNGDPRVDGLSKQCESGTNGTYLRISCMDSARYSRCRGHTKTVSPDLFRGPILFKWAFRRNWTPEQVRGDTLSKCHSSLEPYLRHFPGPSFSGIAIFSHRSKWCLRRMRRGCEGRCNRRTSGKCRSRMHIIVASVGKKSEQK